MCRPGPLSSAAIARYEYLKRIEAERDRYKAALEVIASPNRATYEGPMDAWKIATKALRPDWDGSYEP